MYRWNHFDNQYEQILRQAAARKGLFEPYFKLGAYLRRLAERSRQLEKKALAGGADKDGLAKEASDSLTNWRNTRMNWETSRKPLMFDVEQAFRTTLVDSTPDQVRPIRISKMRLKAGQRFKPTPGISDALQS